MGNSLTVQEWQRFLVRKLRKYHVLSEDIPCEENVPLDPTPIDLGDGRGAVDSLAEIDGLPAPSIETGTGPPHARPELGVAAVAMAWLPAIMSAPAKSSSFEPASSRAPHSS